MIGLSIHRRVMPFAIAAFLFAACDDSGPGAAGDTDDVRDELHAVLWALAKAEGIDPSTLRWPAPTITVDVSGDPAVTDDTEAAMGGGEQRYVSLAGAVQWKRTSGVGGVRSQSLEIGVRRAALDRRAQSAGPCPTRERDRLVLEGGFAYDHVAKKSGTSRLVIERDKVTAEITWGDGSKTTQRILPSPSRKGPATDYLAKFGRTLADQVDQITQAEIDRAEATGVYGTANASVTSLSEDWYRESNLSGKEIAEDHFARVSAFKIHKYDTKKLRDELGGGSSEAHWRHAVHAAVETTDANGTLTSISVDWSRRSATQDCVGAGDLCALVPALVGEHIRLFGARNEAERKAFFKREITDRLGGLPCAQDAARFAQVTVAAQRIDPSGAAGATNVPPATDAKALKDAIAACCGPAARPECPGKPGTKAIVAFARVLKSPMLEKRMCDVAKVMPKDVATPHSSNKVPARVAEPTTAIRYLGSLRLDWDQVLDAALNDYIQCQTLMMGSMMTCGGEPFSPGAAILTFSVTDEAVPLVDAGQMDEYILGFAFQRDADPKNDFIPAIEYPDDFFKDADWALHGSLSRDLGWQLEIFDPNVIRPEDKKTAGRLLIVDELTLTLIPATEFMSELPKVRATTFRHKGDYGMAPPYDWSGDVRPRVADGFESTSMY